MNIRKVKGGKVGKFEKLENKFISISPEDIAIPVNHSSKMEWELKPSVVIENRLQKCIKWS
jgi:hypothetical protein